MCTYVHTLPNTSPVVKFVTSAAIHIAVNPVCTLLSQLLSQLSKPLINCTRLQRDRTRPCPFSKARLVFCKQTKTSVSQVGWIGCEVSKTLGLLGTFQVFCSLLRLISSTHHARYYYALSDHLVRQDSAVSPVARFKRSTLPFTRILAHSSIICSNSFNNSSPLASPGRWLPCCRRSRLIRSSRATGSRIGFPDKLPCLRTRKSSRPLLRILSSSLVGVN
jgi:hypothetical protein